MLEGERGEVRVADGVAGRSGMLEQAAEEREVPPGRLDHDDRRRAEPGLDCVGGLANGERAREDGRVRGEAKEGHDHRPGERHGFAASECLAHEGSCRVMLPGAPVRRVQEHVGVDQL